MRRRSGKIREVLINEASFERHKRKLRYLKKRRNFRKFQISMIRYRVIARIIVFLLVLLAFIRLVNLPQWYLNKDIFNCYPNSSIEIDGNKIISTSQIMAALKPIHLPAKPVYLLDTKILEKAILKLTPVKKVYVRRFWLPARLKIVIEEKVPILAISTVPKVAPVLIFTDDGSSIGKDFLPIHTSKKIYSIITYDNFYKWNLNQIKSLTYLARFLESYSGEKLVYLDIRNPDDVFVQLVSFKLRIGELNKTVFKRTERIESVLTEAIKIRNQIDYIDLRWENYPSIKLKDKKPQTNPQKQKNND